MRRMRRLLALALGRVEQTVTAGDGEQRALDLTFGG